MSGFGNIGPFGPPIIDEDEINNKQPPDEDDPYGQPSVFIAMSTDNLAKT